MKFIKRIRLSRVPKIQDRLAFCEENCLNHIDHIGSNICYMCHSLEESEVRDWLERFQDRYLYILLNETLPKRRRCQWCEEGKYEKQHFAEHGKTECHAKLLETQRELNSEMLQVYRTGRWWAVALTLGRCQQCLEAGQLKCSMPTTPRSRNRCAASICLDFRDIIKGDPWKWGMILV